MFLLPIKVNESLSLPLTPINYLLNYLNSVIDSNLERKLIIKKLYKRVKIKSLYKNKSFFFEKLKIEIPLVIIRKLIKFFP